MEQWESLKRKQLKVIFEDGPEHYSKKEGELINYTSTHLILKTGNCQVEGIRIASIIRFEVIE